MIMHYYGTSKLGVEALFHCLPVRGSLASVSTACLPNLYNQTPTAKNNITVPIASKIIGNHACMVRAGCWNFHREGPGCYEPHPQLHPYMGVVEAL